jgi:hypothetical protein
MGSKTAVLKTCRFSGFNQTFERFQRIPDIQDKTGKPIMIPTANVAIRQSAKVSFLILSAWMLGPALTRKNSPSRWNG